GAGKLAIAHRTGGVAHLLHDLAHGEVAVQPTLAGRAERACHDTAGRRGDAQGGAAWVAHQDGFQQRVIVAAPERLAGLPIIGIELAQRGHQLREELLLHGLSAGFRKVRHLERIALEASVILVVELLRTELRKPELHHRFLNLLSRQIGEVLGRKPSTRRGKIQFHGGSHSEPYYSTYALYLAIPGHPPGFAGLKEWRTHPDAGSGAHSSFE